MSFSEVSFVEKSPSSRMTNFDNSLKHWLVLVRLIADFFYGERSYNHKFKKVIKESTLINCNQSKNITNYNNFSTTAKSITVYIMKFIALLSKSWYCCPNPGRTSSSTTQQCFIVSVGESRNSLNRWKKSPSLFSKIEPYHFVFMYVE